MLVSSTAPQDIQTGERMTHCLEMQRMVGEQHHENNLSMDEKSRAAEVERRMQLSTQVIEKVRIKRREACHSTISKMLSAPSALSTYIQSLKMIMQLIDELADQPDVKLVDAITEHHDHRELAQQARSELRQKLLSH